MPLQNIHEMAPARHLAPALVLIARVIFLGVSLGLTAATRLQATSSEPLLSHGENVIGDLRLRQQAGDSDASDSEIHTEADAEVLDAIRQQLAELRSEGLTSDGSEGEDELSLSDANFDTRVGNGEAWFVKFYVSAVGSCDIVQAHGCRPACSRHGVPTVSISPRHGRSLRSAPFLAS